MNTKVIPDLSAALTLAGKAGLKEHQMIHEARALLTKPFGIVFRRNVALLEGESMRIRALRLMNRRENVKKELEKAMKFRAVA